MTMNDARGYGGGWATGLPLWGLTLIMNQGADMRRSMYAYVCVCVLCLCLRLRSSSEGFCSIFQGMWSEVVVCSSCGVE